MKDNNPTVSVVVITYNSESYIIETLNSVKQQIYNNIELIISDDCSTDKTIQYIKSWLRDNAKYFTRTQIIESPRNTGVTPNINRGIKAATGEWIKLLSGDDILSQYSIEEYIKFINSDPSNNICFGKLFFIGNNEELKSVIRTFYENKLYPYIKGSYSIQWRRIQLTMFVPGPGLFFSKELWSKIEGFDERYPFADEYPFIYKVLESGERISFIDKELYGYQVRGESLSHVDGNMLHPRVFYDQYHYIKNTHVPKAIKHGFLFEAVHVLITYLRMEMKYKNLPKIIQRLTLLLYLLSPYSYIYAIRRLLHIKI